MLVAVGAVLALVILSDAVRTTISLTSRRGPIARTVMRAGRAVAARLPRRARSAAGVVITLAVIVSWTFGLWVAWWIALLDPAITFVASDGTVTDGALTAFYVAGYAIFTLGTGDVSAATDLGRIVTVVASGTGLFTVTLEVTYLLSLTSAASHERSIARQVHALAPDVATFVQRSWDGETFASIEQTLERLAQGLSDLAERHRTFPVLHDVLPDQRPLALGPSLLALSDAVEAMHLAAGRDARIGRVTYQQVMEAIDGLLQGLPPGADPPAPPPPPDPAALLASVGCEIDDADLATDQEAIVTRRRGLFGLAAEEGWEQAAIEAVRLPTSSGGT